MSPVRHPVSYVAVAGVLFSVALVLAIPDEVFFNGDAGVKSLLTYQLAEGRVKPDLDLQAPDWARALWRDGFYPFERPFVYRVDGRYYSEFPFAFSLLSAPFYALLGFRGLYVVPLAGLWLVWLGADRLARRFGATPGERAAGLALLAFASPVTLYAAMVTERTLSIGLAVLGLSHAVECGDRPGRRAALAAGLLVGSAVWLREEILLLSLLAGGLALAPGVPRALRPAGARPRPFVLGLVVSTALWIAFNRVSYGHSLGLRFVQLSSGADRAVADEAAATIALWLAETLGMTVVLWRELFAYFPAAALGFAVLVPAIRRGEPVRRGLVCLALAAAFLLAAPLGMPNLGGRQWGPRHLLVCVPLLSAFAVAALSAARRERRLGAVFGALLALAFAAGAWRNSWEGPRMLAGNYAGRTEALRFVRADPGRVLVVSHSFVARQLASTFRDKLVFVAPSGRDLRRLAGELRAQGQQEFLYLCYPAYPCAPGFRDAPARVGLPTDDAPEVWFTRVGAVGRYWAYRGLIPAAATDGALRAPPPPPGRGPG